MKRFILVAGARPNFMKIAPLITALAGRGAEVLLVHTGQHYDPLLSDIFFDELGIPKPDAHLGIGSGTRIEQTRKIWNGLAEYLKPHVGSATLVTVGDVTSTAAAALAGVAVGMPVAHVEAGLRSFNWKMPEELNRMIADHHSDILFATEDAGVKNLRDEGIDASRIHLVGNVMIDTLRRMEPKARDAQTAKRLELPERYGLMTLHRPENVDDPATLKELWTTLTEISADLPLAFPVHPRTRARIDAAGLAVPSTIRLIDPVGYIDMLSLVLNAACVLTDSGGLQEETWAFDVPCLTMRNETERPVTVTLGTSEIVGRDRTKILDAWNRVKGGGWKHGSAIPLWDGHASERIAEILV